MQRVGLRSRTTTEQQENAGGLRGKSALPTRARPALGDVNRSTTAKQDEAEIKKTGYGAQGQSRLARPPLHNKENAAAAAVSRKSSTSSIFQKSGLLAGRASKPLTRQAAAANLKQTVKAGTPAKASPMKTEPLSPTDVDMPSPAKESPEPVEMTEDRGSTHSYSTAMIPDIDEGDEEDPQLASRFAVDIYKYLRFYEKKWTVPEGFLSSKIVTPRMRGILVDWLQQVHTRFHLLPETMYLTVHIIDRYLAKTEVPKDQLQLVGVTGMLIAAKYEEMYAPEVNDFVYITDDTYTAKQVLAMELKMLSALGCNLGRPLPIHFLRRFSKAAEADYIVHTMGKYFMELALCEYTLASDLPSHVAGASLFLTLTLLAAKEEGSLSTVEDKWTAVLIHYSGLREADFAPSVTKLAKLLLKVHTDKTKLQAVRLKFASPKFHNISQHEALNLDHLRALAAE